MKFLSILISLMISFNLMAADVSGRRLSNLVDDFQYSLTVEWDQNDKKELKKLSDKFQADLSKIIQEDGISKDELQQFLESKITDKQLMDDMQLRIKLMPSNPSSDEIYSLFQEMKSNMYSQGASWNGEILLHVGLWLGVAAFLAFIIHSLATMNEDSCKNKGGTETTVEKNCGIRTVCVNHGMDYCYEYQEQYKCDQVTECIL